MSDTYSRLPLHQGACNELYYQVQECEKSHHALSKIFGKCSDVHVALTKCLKQNKLNLAAANREQSRIRQENARKKLKAEKNSNKQ